MREPLLDIKAEYEAVLAENEQLAEYNTQLIETINNRNPWG